MTWKQEGNPLASFNKDMNPENIVLSSNLVPFDGFNGLSLSSREDLTLIDGNGNSGNWWYSVGYKKPG